MGYRSRVGSEASCLAPLLLLCVFASSSVHAGCPHMRGLAGGNAAAMPVHHPPVEAHASRKLMQASPVTYKAAMQALIADLQSVIGTCQFALEGMAYRDNTNIVVNSTSVFFPAASWLRAFFHDAGTYIAQPSRGGPKGGPNGSLGVGCTTNPCGNLTGVNGPIEAPADTATCANGAAPVGGFSDDKLYCCPLATQCVAHSQSPNGGPTPGLTVPVCLDGSDATVELCRRENDGLVPTIQFFRGRQANVAFQYDSPEGKKKLSLADIIVAGAAVVVKQCSGGQLSIPHTFGRPEATVADDVLLPSPNAVIEQKHFEIFQNMGLNKIDMVTLVTGSHSIGGFRKVSSPGLTAWPYVPFDCTPAGQISSPPFDNNVFKVACDGVSGVSKGACEWNTKCSNPALDETANGCPFEEKVRDAFQQCGATSYPTPGLSSDIFLCNEPSTKGRMVQYANDQAFFFAKYKDLFANMANLGFKKKDLVTIASRRRRTPVSTPP